jgi:hypothetical protein
MAVDPAMIVKYTINNTCLSESRGMVLDTDVPLSCNDQYFIELSRPGSFVDTYFPRESGFRCSEFIKQEGELVCDGECSDMETACSLRPSPMC